MADPFAIVKNGKIYVLCEEFDHGGSKGRIICFEVLGEDQLSEAKVVFEPPYSISYPYLFEYQGDIYCVPETYQTRELSLYRAQTFPCDWIRVGTLLADFPAVDATIFQHEGRWWLTCGDEHLAHGLDRLFIWHADDPRGPWVPHEKNPVKIDVSSSRSAGTPFTHNGNLYRPAQDCSQTYGGRVVLNRIVKLTRTEFQEEVVSFVDPDSRGPYPDGLHTVSSAQDITFVDGKRLQNIASATFKGTI